MGVMKVILTSIVILSLMIFALSGESKAVTIVDTGALPHQGSGFTLREGLQWIAGEFELTETYLVDSVEGWLWDNDGTVSLAIYGDAGAIPDTTDEIFRDTFTVVDNSGPLSGSGWFGPNSMGLALTPGTYWAAFEVRNTETYDGAMEDTALAPLPTYALDLNGDGAIWNSVPNANIGLRVTGDRHEPIPEPTTIALLGIGLAGLAGAEVRRRRKKKAVDKS